MQGCFLIYQVPWEYSKDVSGKPDLHFRVTCLACLQRNVSKLSGPVRRRVHVMCTTQLEQIHLHLYVRDHMRLEHQFGTLCKAG